MLTSTISAAYALDEPRLIDLGEAEIRDAAALSATGRQFVAAGRAVFARDGAACAADLEAGYAGYERMGFIAQWCDFFVATAHAARTCA